MDLCSGLCCSAVSAVTTNLMDRKQKLYYLVDFDGLRLNIAVLFFYISINSGNHIGTLIFTIYHLENVKAPYPCLYIPKKLLQCL